MEEENIFIDDVEFSADKKTLIRFPEDSKIKEYVVPDSVKTIRKHAFWGCTSLTSVTIPNSVTTIGGSTFSG